MRRVANIINRASGYGVPPDRLSPPRSSGGGASADTMIWRIFNSSDDAVTLPAKAGTPYPDTKVAVAPGSAVSYQTRLDCLVPPVGTRPGTARPGSPLVCRALLPSPIAPLNAARTSQREVPTFSGAAALEVGMARRAVRAAFSGAIGDEPNASATSVTVRAFTLLEMMVAIMISGIALTAINTVLFGALRLRAKTVAITEQTLPIDAAVETMKRDLQCITPPNTSTNLTNGLRGLFGTDAISVGLSQPLLLEFFTSSGTVGDALPWGDMQKVDYWLQPSTNRSGPPGRDLVRGVTRNLLPVTVEPPEEKQVLLQDVQRMQFAFYDGTNWNEVWSTSLSNIPVAIKASITFSKPQAGGVLIPPIQFVVPVVCTASTNQSSTNVTAISN